MKKAAAYLLYALVRLLYMTLRVRVEGKEALVHCLKMPRKPLIVALWHSRLMLLAPLMRKAAPIVPFTVLISKSRDGDIPSFYAELFKDVHVIRVGHKARGSALHESIHALERGEVLVLTPDGPRGPNQEVKPGALFAAEKCDADIVAMGWEVSKAIYLKSWDRFCIPLPFSEVVLRFKRVEERSPEALKSTLDKTLGGH